MLFINFVNKKHIIKLKLYILCIANQERSFGSKHVVFSSVIFPESVIFINCDIETRKRANATFISPVSTRFLIPKLQNGKFQINYCKFCIESYF